MVTDTDISPVIMKNLWWFNYGLSLRFLSFQFTSLSSVLMIRWAVEAEELLFHDLINYGREKVDKKDKNSRRDGKIQKERDLGVKITKDDPI